MSVSKNTLKKIGHPACLRDMTGQSCRIFACAGNNHTRYFIGSEYILRYLGARVFKVTVKKNLMSRKSSAFEKIGYIICGKVTRF